VGQHLLQSCLCRGADHIAALHHLSGPGQSDAGYGWGFFLLRLSISRRAVRLRAITATGTNGVSRRLSYVLFNNPTTSPPVNPALTGGFMCCQDVLFEGTTSTPIKEVAESKSK
jgi:hypothetical protein